MNVCHFGDCRDILRRWIAEGVKVQMCVTSPPYWGLRDYGVAGQFGLEFTPQEYVERMVEVFRLVRELLADDGTVWLNLGDSYCAAPKGSLNRQDKSGLTSTRTQEQSPIGISKLRVKDINSKQATNPNADGLRRNHSFGDLKAKDLCMIPAEAALALRADGWWLRSKITWCKKVPMPESVRDRPTSATEDIFILSKSANYYYNADAVRNPPSESFLNDPRWQTGSTDENEKEGYKAAGAQNQKKINKMFDKHRRH